MDVQSVQLPKVSIIIPCYNQSEFLEEAVHSVIGQTYKNWECIIVNDGSLDDTEEVALYLCTRDKRISYFKKGNGGVSEARNFGVDKSRGQYILPLDGDDRIGEKYLELAINEFEKDDEVKLVYCESEYFGDKCGIWKLEPYSYENLIIRNLLFCSALYKKEDFYKVGGYNEKLKTGLEDWDFWIRLLKKNDKVVKLNSIQFYYRIKAVSRNTKIANVKSQSKLLEQIYQNNKEIYIDFIESKYGVINAIRLLKKIDKLKTNKLYMFFIKLERLLGIRIF